VKGFFSHSFSHHISNHANSLKGKIKGMDKIQMIIKIKEFFEGDFLATIK
jgi:hypothetical protein